MQNMHLFGILSSALIFCVAAVGMAHAEILNSLDDLKREKFLAQLCFDFERTGDFFSTGCLLPAYRPLRPVVFAEEVQLSHFIKNGLEISLGDTASLTKFRAAKLSPELASRIVVLDLSAKSGELDSAFDLNLPNLSHLEVRGSEEFAFRFGSRYPELTHLELSRPSAIDGLEELEMLKYLRIDSHNLQSVPKLRELESIESFILKSDGLQKVPSLKSETLTSLHIGGDKIEKIDVWHLPSLRRLSINSVDNLKSLPAISDLKNLESLMIWGNRSLDTVPSLTELKSLKRVQIDFDGSLTKLPEVEGLDRLESLIFVYWRHNEESSLTEFPSIRGLKSLNHLVLQGPRSIPFPPGLHTLKNLKSFWIFSGQMSDITFDQLTALPKLRELRLSVEFSDGQFERRFQIKRQELGLPPVEIFFGGPSDETL